MTLEPFDAPPCPLCGERMSLKVAQRGWQAGTSFWGCPRFPVCRGLLDLAHGFDEPSAAKLPDAKPQFGRDEFRLRVGGFVWTYDRALLGKLTELAPGRARVRIVHSALHQDEREYDPAQLRRAQLSPQTRVYLRDDEREAWTAGRVHVRRPCRWGRQPCLRRAPPGAGRHSGPGEGTRGSVLRAYGRSH